jgi:myo-inositol 2-dehydrogenase/D-chiro-inositol 1-dehydrogenase
VGFQERHNIPFVEIRRAVREGALGDILMIRATGRIPRKRLTKGWLFNTEHGGGAVLESSIHNWDLARWITGQEFTRVFAEGIWMEKMGTEYDDTFCAVARLSGGAILQIETCFSLPDGAAFDSRIEFVGTRGMAYYDNARQPLLVNSEVGYRLADRTATGSNVVNLVHVGPDMGAYRREHAHFHACLRGGAAPAATVDDSRRSLRVALAALESMRLHQPVTLA